MKDLFPGYYPYTHSEKRDFINEATIVFGASVLLDLFRISHGRVFLDIIEDHVPKERLWLPYDTVWLYHNRLPSVIDEQIEEDNNASKHLTAFKRAIHNPFGHPFITQELMNEFEGFICKLEESIESDRKILLSCLTKHDLKDRINDLFHGRVGREYDDSQTIQVFDESKKRNEIQLPPCLTFSSSSEPRIIHNRYVVWKQIQQYAKENEKSILIVLNRITPNWFFIYKDAVVTPHQYLINEFKKQTGQNVYIMSVHDFLEHLLKPAEKTAEIQKLLSQLHDKPTMGYNQQITPIMSKEHSI